MGFKTCMTMYLTSRLSSPKARAVLPKDGDEAKIDGMGLYNKYCATHHPIKEDSSGNIEFQIKCSAYKDNKNGTFTPRPVHVYELYWCQSCKNTLH